MILIKKSDVDSQLMAARAHIYMRSVQKVGISRKTSNRSRQLLRDKPVVSADQC
jgi:hypothetical protein